MHSYATNSPLQLRLIVWLAGLAAGISIGVGWVTSWAKSSWGFNVGGISAMTAFALLYFIFDRWLWKLKPLRAWLLIPDLNGTWRCEGKAVDPTSGDVAHDWSAEIRICQSWSRIGVVLKAASSSSRSISASVYHHPGEGFRLIYVYDNTPKADQVRLARHSGQCDLIFAEDLQSAEGRYFNDGDRLTSGTMRLLKGSNA
ncbi:MAG: hypothetical protein AB7O38_07245 [Pirellulaceae bacterium]